jgi:hypothetical protein
MRGRQTPRIFSAVDEFCADARPRTCGIQVENFICQRRFGAFQKHDDFVRFPTTGAVMS